MNVDDLRSQFTPQPGHLDAATCGVAPLASLERWQQLGLEWAAGRLDPAELGAQAELARSSFARLVGVPTGDVALGATASLGVDTVARGLPSGARVVLVEDDFTSVTYPFTTRGDLRITAVPLSDLAEAVDRGCDVVAFSLVASRTGAIAEADAVVAAARRVGALTVADLTQAAGWFPTAAHRFDVTVTAAYKWLCCPRGVAFLTLTSAARERLRPLGTGWYAGEDPWTSVYGTTAALASDARRFDLSPAWLSYATAAPALEAFAAVPASDVAAHDVALADSLLTGLDLAPRGSAIVSLPDPDGAARTALERAGCRVAGRGGGVRLAFHLWNTAEDVDRALAALRPHASAAA